MSAKNKLAALLVALAEAAVLEKETVGGRRGSASAMCPYFVLTDRSGAKEMSREPGFLLLILFKTSTMQHLNLHSTCSDTMLVLRRQY